MSTQSVSLAGEFFVLAQLSLQGLIGTLTLGHTKNIDVLVSNLRTGNLFRVEVKTASKGPIKSKQFGCNYEWIMDKKHESIVDDKLFYCFVQLLGNDKMPLFFIVPSKDVADYVKKEHEYWLKLPRKKQIKKEDDDLIPIRMFRIAFDAQSHGLKAADYENKWSFFD